MRILIIALGIIFGAVSALAVDAIMILMPGAQETTKILPVKIRHALLWSALDPAAHPATTTMTAEITALMEAIADLTTAAILILVWFSQNQLRTLDPMKLLFSSFFFFSLFFLTGCTASDIFQHESFSVSLPRWEQQDITTSSFGFITGISISDDFCTVHFTISQTPLLPAAKFQLDSLSSHNLTLYDKSVSESEVFLAYGLFQEDTYQGDLRIMTCPNKFTYTVDYRCTSAAYERRTKDIFTLLDSMQC